MANDVSLNKRLPRTTGRLVRSVLCLNVQTQARHHEFLFDTAGDPRPAFADSLLYCLGETGTIVIYTGYEKTAIESLADVMPSRGKRLRSLVTRLWDLCEVVRKNFYHPEFRGSFSIKDVLPVLVSQLSYDSMEVSDGLAAVWAYYRLVSNALPKAERQALRTSLLEYCKLDTLAMVEVYEGLQSI